MSSKRILVVDDDAVFLRAISTRLRAEGYEVMVAEDGSSAMGTIRQGIPDLILLDICFPPDVGHGGGVSWDGFLIMDWLRRAAGITDTPIILVTAADPAQYMERAKKAGATGLVQKTIDPSILMRIIHQILDKQAVAA